MDIATEKGKQYLSLRSGIFMALKFVVGGLSMFFPQRLTPVK